MLSTLVPLNHLLHYKQRTACAFRRPLDPVCDARTAHGPAYHSDVMVFTTGTLVCSLQPAVLRAVFMIFMLDVKEKPIPYFPRFPGTFRIFSLNVT